MSYNSVFFSQVETVPHKTFPSRRNSYGRAPLNDSSRHPSLTSLNDNDCIVLIACWRLEDCTITIAKITCYAITYTQTVMNRILCSCCYSGLYELSACI